MNSAGVTWVRSSRCRDANCVEVAEVGAGVLVRDTKERGEGVNLSFAGEAWGAFVRSLRSPAGEFVRR
ncbi:DUF397 domain-containing protein [Catenuloplanes japonicus]|uniref:DUF397 domain-containing protein n=1 Tax=Catenuloplanes japonicus TaxID=33876 RepID=UPI000A106A74|nr:DUF397 domain-containing protein [Catenuloplanes japonicus]